MRDWPRMPSSIIVVFVALVACFSGTARAQAPREYLNTPVDQFAGFLEYTFAQEQSAASADLPLPNDLTFSGVTVPYLLYSFPLNGKYAGVDVTAPFVRAEAADGSFETRGFSDPSFAFHMNLFGLPAVRKEELATFIPQNLMSIHFKVNPPIGEYDRNSPVNTGANRWAFSPLVNLNITPDKGMSWFEFYAAGKFFTDNHELQGSKTLLQDPMLVLTAHYSHNIGKRYWASIGANYDYGGETSIDGVPQDNGVNGFRPMVVVSGMFGSFRVTARYENTATEATDHSRNGSVTLRVGALLF